MLSTELLIATSSLLGLIVLAAAVLKGWQGWLDLKERELALYTSRRAPEIEGGASEGAARIEI